MIKESFLNEGFEGENLVTGEDVAQILGPEAVKMYEKGKQQIELDNQMKENVQKDFNSFLKRLDKTR